MAKKKKNEVNGVLVYRRWGIGAILSIFILMLIIAVPVFMTIYDWLVIKVPDGSAVSAAETYRIVGLDLLRPILKKELAFQTLINDIAGVTSVKYFALITKVMLYTMFGFLAFSVLIGVIQAFFFLFYLFTGRVASPAAAVKTSWVVFVCSLIYAGLSFGVGAFISSAYASAAGEKFNFLNFLLTGIVPAINGNVSGNGFIVNFFWPLVYVGVALIGAILLSIVYGCCFKDKFFIGRAKRFGSGEIDGHNGGGYTSTNVYNTVPAPNGAQPQIIVVNGGPIPGAQPGTVYQAIPPVQSAPVQSGTPSEEVAVPSASLPNDIKSIGGHAYSKNLDLKYADVPDGIKELGVAAFANCLNLEIVSLPKSIKRIKKNCFFNCARLVRINYAGTKADWRYVARGSNWLEKAGTKTVVCSDGAIIVDPHR